MSVKKKTGTTIAFLAVILGVSSLLPVKEHFYPRKTIRIVPATLFNLMDVVNVLTVSRNASYVQFLSPQSAAYMFKPTITQRDFVHTLKSYVDPADFIGIAKTAYGVPVGFIVTKQIASYAVFIDWLFILPEYQGKKIGRALINYGVAHAQDEYPETSIAQVECQPGNKQAIHFYLREGFVVVKEYPEFDYSFYVLVKYLDAPQPISSYSQPDA